jgi:mediator of RNA polymerase II transcription subunit 13
MIDSLSPPLHVNILCTEAEAPWSIINARRCTNTSQASSARTTAKKLVFTDISSHTYMLQTQTRVPLSLPLRTTFCQLFIPEFPSDTPSTVIDSESDNISKATEDKDQIPHPLPLLPRSSMTLICMPSSTASIPIFMLHIHLLYTISSRHTSTSPDYSKLHEEITHNFYELSLLARLRWKSHANPVLPFHLGAVELMRNALERDKDRAEAA